MKRYTPRDNTNVFLEESDVGHLTFFSDVQQLARECMPHVQHEFWQYAHRGERTPPELTALIERLRAIIGDITSPQITSERESQDGVAKDQDGCPQENAVLKRFWRAHHAEVSQLRAALQPLAHLPSFHDLEDDVVVFSNSGKCITAGDVRRARAIIGDNSAAEPRCGTCHGRGEVGGFVNAESGYQTDQCPTCSPKETAKEHCECNEPKKSTQGDWCTVCFRTIANRSVRQEMPGPKQPPRLHGEECRCGDFTRQGCPAREAATALCPHGIDPKLTRCMRCYPYRGGKPD